MKLGRAIGVLAACVTLTCRAIARKASGGQLLPGLVADQKRIWSFPVTAARGDAWKPAVGVIGVTAVLVSLDPILTPWLQQAVFQQNPAVRRINGILSGRHTAIAINAAWSLFFIGGIARGNSYASQTGLLAGEAAADAEILAGVMKHVDRRMRPSEVGPAGDFTRTWFRTKNRSIDGYGCFPSGHTTAAFAIATVFAERYGSYRWAKWVAFGLAGIVGASRLTSRAHFPSDVFLGGVLGYSISHFVVLERQRGTRDGFPVGVKKASTPALFSGGEAENIRRLRAVLLSAAPSRSSAAGPKPWPQLGERESDRRASNDRPPLTTTLPHLGFVPQ